jgi:hypothetical protein
MRKTHSERCLKPMYRNEIIQLNRSSKTAKCLACGQDIIKPGRRYCTKLCREQIDWVLSLSKGLLRAFNARYAAFYFNSEHVVLDVLPIWSKEISRFVYRRRPGKKPAKDLKRLVLQAGREWHCLVENRNSRSFASLALLERNKEDKIDPESIKPSKRMRPRLPRQCHEYLRILKLNKEDMSSNGHMVKIKSAYKTLAKLHHPDMGGDEEKFKKLNEAHEKMLLWAEDPQFTSRKALPACWSYDGFTNRWAPPL